MDKIRSSKNLFNNRSWSKNQIRYSQICFLRNFIKRTELTSFLSLFCLVLYCLRKFSCKDSRINWYGKRESRNYQERYWKRIREVISFNFKNSFSSRIDKTNSNQLYGTSLSCFTPFSWRNRVQVPNLVRNIPPRFMLCSKPSRRLLLKFCLAKNLLDFPL